MPARRILAAPFIIAISRATASVVVLLAVSVLPVAAAPTYPPGSGVGLEPPAGMAVATDFEGFQRGFASIVVVEMPAGAYTALDDQRGLVAKKVEGGKVQDFSANDVNGFIVRGTQSLGARVFRKWVVVLGAPKETTLVTAQVPTDETDVTDAAVEAALRTIAFRNKPDAAEAIAALPFTVGDTAGFRSTGALLGATIGFTEGPKDVDPDDTQPSVIVSTSLNHPLPAHMGRLDFAVVALKSRPYLASVEVRSAKLVDANGAQWAEVTGTANNSGKGVPLEVALFLRFGPGDGFIIVKGTWRTGTGYADRFRRLALSVEPKG